VSGEEFSEETSGLPDGGGGGQADVTMPLGTGELPDEAAALDPLASAGTKRKISGGSVLIAAVVLIAAGGLFAMRQLAEATAASDADHEIELTIESFLKTITGQRGPTSRGGQTTVRGQSDRALAVLTTEYSERQVPLRDVQRNPFIIFQPPPSAPPTADEIPAQSSQQELRWQQKRQQHQTAIEREGANLTLKSVLGGSTPLAVVNNKIVRIGDTVATSQPQITFRVLSIETDAVKLVSTAPELDLRVTVTLSLHHKR